MNQIVSENVESKIVLINGKLFEVYTDGRIYRFNKKGDKLIVENTANHSCGYNLITCNGKTILRHRIIGFVFLGLNIDDPTQCIDHIDGCRINNCVSNLRGVNNQQNHFNRTKAKGYSWNKHAQKFEARIKLNGKLIYLGLFDTEEKARESYITAKLVYHQIN